MRKTESSIHRLYYGVHEKKVLCFSVPGHQHRQATYCWLVHSGHLHTWRNFSWSMHWFHPTQKNVHTCQEGRLSRRVTWFVTHLQGIRLASAKLGTTLLQARALGWYSCTVSLSNKQKTVAWLEAMVPDLYQSQKEDSCWSAFQVLPCTNIYMKDVWQEWKLWEWSKEEGVLLFWSICLPRRGVTLLLPTV